MDNTKFEDDDHMTKHICNEIDDYLRKKFSDHTLEQRLVSIHKILIDAFSFSSLVQLDPRNREDFIDFSLKNLLGVLKHSLQDMKERLSEAEDELDSARRARENTSIH